MTEDKTRLVLLMAVGDKKIGQWGSKVHQLQHTMGVPITCH